MKKTMTVLLFFPLLAGAEDVVASTAQKPLQQAYPPESFSGRHTFTLGYTESHISHFKAMKGVNAKYRYEIPELPLSAMVSFSGMSGRGSQSVGGSDAREVKHHRVRYYSLMVGPAWRATSWASLYLLGGAGWESSSNQTDYHNPGGDSTGRYKIFDARFAWGAGVQFNLIDNVAVDVGYQAGHVQKTSSNGFNVGIGYRF
ncbi:Ail/Lom family outer membrane beta-barrel protein [Erwinia sp. JH02]|uniref:Ail/Lom family outer membrane beta-barrel protein n=1 Tax=Erwinia sp. JH02 TaxID=2733394 RepID=UPI001488A4F1|nr:Ail/Lom family outer membrane beta-barrel protein [Erwinia sp. JH02]NNS06449.1 Ail/Lom family outer membrane beta-barrel protein [Erwinia sp. JH02]